MQWYFLISSYYLTVLNGHSLTALESVEVTQHSGSFKWGVLSLISSYYLTVSNGCSLTVLKSVEVTQRSGSFEWGVKQQIYPKSANFELTCHFILCFTEGLFVLHMKDLISLNYRPLSKLGMDLKVMPKSYKGHKFILCIIDEVTNYLITVPMYHSKSEEIGDELIEHIISKYSVPDYKIMDHNSAFMSMLMNYLLKRLNIIIKIVAL